MRIEVATEGESEHIAELLCGAGYSVEQRDEAIAVGSRKALRVHQLLSERHITLAFAESCSGGRLASQMTALPGASNYFLGSLVTYSNAAKQSLLGVSSAVLEAHGAVSQQVARAMAEGLERSLGADISVAVTGVAGPEGEPLGQVWIALMQKNGAFVVERFQFSGKRGEIIDRAVDAALEMIWSAIE